VQGVQDVQDFLETMRAFGRARVHTCARMRGRPRVPARDWFSLKAMTILHTLHIEKKFMGLRCAGL